MNDAIPPAWYPDPSGSGRLRYWDGVQWTDHVTDHPAAASVPQSPAQAPVSAPTGYWSTPARPEVAALQVPLTPDGVPLARYGSRVGAYLLDWLIVTVLSGVLSLPFMRDYIEWVQHMLRSASLGTVDSSDPAFTVQLMAKAWPIALISLAIHLAYHVGFLTWRGATPGKMAAHLAVRAYDRPGKPTVGMALRRQVLVILTSALAFVPRASLLGSLVNVFDLLNPLRDPKRQALHDKIAGTVVVMTPRRDVPTN